MFKEAAKIKITIDTKEDSKHEIRRVIAMLSHLVGEDVRSNKDIFSANKDKDLFSSDHQETEKESENPGSGFLNMFGNDSSTKEPATPIDFSGFTNLVNNSRKKNADSDDEVRVVSY